MALIVTVVEEKGTQAGIEKTERLRIRCDVDAQGVEADAFDASGNRIARTGLIQNPPDFEAAPFDFLRTVSQQLGLDV